MSASTEISIIEKNLGDMRGKLQAMIPPVAGLQAQRMIHSVLASCEKNESLLQANRQSLFTSAFSLATLGLVADGFTGQGYLVPFKGAVQPQVGFKGHGTLAARSGFILHGDVIREDDDYDVKLGTGGYINVRPKFGRRADRKIVASYATLESKSFPPIVLAMDIDEIERVRASSQMKNGAPWSKWFDQMAIKTAKKRLAKSSPLDALHLASALDDLNDQGQGAQIDPERGMLTVGGNTVYPDRQPERDEPLSLADDEFPVRKADGTSQLFNTFDEWRAHILVGIKAQHTDKGIKALMLRNRDVIEALAEKYPDQIRDLAHVADEWQNAKETN